MSDAALDCGYRPPGDWVAAYRAGVERGEVPDPASRTLPPIPWTVASAPAGPPDPTPCLSRAHVFPFEDTAGVLLTDYSDAQLLDLMAQAYVAMIATYGDVYDFGGFFLNYTPSSQIGAAFYMPIFNDVMGLGDPSTAGTPIFDERANLGVGASSRIQGYVMMWRVQDWVGGSGPGADFTRLALAQEFEHRFAMFLPDLLDGRALQGDDSGCGRTFHWNWKVDGQGSGMEISEWVGVNPAVPQGLFVSFNTDIPGGVFSYTDLYLMGYVTPAEMDAGNSELRYMETSSCSSNYSGSISSFGSAQIVAAAGPRVPAAAAATQHYRTGWIMLHLPNNPPTPAQLDLAVSVLEQHEVDWNFGTLGRGTMDDQLFDDCNCNDVPDLTDVALGTSPDANVNGRPDECEPAGTPFCFGDALSCPCANAGAAGHGCENAQGLGGVQLQAVGDPAQNDVALVATNFSPATTPAVVAIRSTLPQTPPIVFGDGLRCVSLVSFVRVKSGAALNGTAVLPLVHSAGAGSFHYQTWYRSNPASFCDPTAAFNLSNGLTIVWP